MVIGIRRKAYRLATVFALCALCSRPAAQAVTRIRTFFSLFFIPVVPLGSSYRSTCTLCGHGVRINKEDAETLVALARGAADQPGPAPYPAPAMPPAPPVMPPTPPPTLAP